MSPGVRPTDRRLGKCLRGAGSAMVIISSGGCPSLLRVMLRASAPATNRSTRDAVGASIEEDRTACAHAAAPSIAVCDAAAAVTITPANNVEARSCWIRPLTARVSYHRQQDATLTSAWIAFLLGASTLILYSFRLDFVPAFLKYEEVFFALESHAIAATLRDTHGRFLPLYLQVYENAWYQPVLVYWSALFQWLLHLRSTRRTVYQRPVSAPSTWC